MATDTAICYFCFCNTATVMKRCLVEHALNG
jgi:hypothetical protein